MLLLLLVPFKQTNYLSSPFVFAQTLAFSSYFRSAHFRCCSQYVVGAYSTNWDVANVRGLLKRATVNFVLLSL
jgi:hypothetical protein